jgi:hypothetical protein
MYSLRHHVGARVGDADLPRGAVRGAAVERGAVGDRRAARPDEAPPAPNPRYGGRVLWMATAMDFCFGEAFWLKIRDGNGKVVELWWVPRA